MNKPPAAQNHLNERTPGAAIAVGKGMNGLQLSVSDRRLCHRRQAILLAKQDEVVHQGRHALRGRRHKGGRTGVIGTASNPILLGAPVPAVAGQGAPDQHAAMTFRISSTRSAVRPQKAARAHLQALDARNSSRPSASVSTSARADALARTNAASASATSAATSPSRRTVRSARGSGRYTRYVQFWRSGRGKPDIVSGTQRRRSHSAILTHPHPSPPIPVGWQGQPRWPPTLSRTR